MSVRVLIPTLAWRRPALLDLWAAYHTALAERHALPGVEVDVLICGSEPEAEEAAERYGCRYVHAANAPLGAKAQARLEATRDLEWDYLLFLGSDDFVAAPTLAYYAERMEAGHDFIAPLDLFSWARPRRTPPRVYGLWHSAGYTPEAAAHRAGEPMAVGRCLSRDLVERLGWQIWPPVERHIDRPAWQRIRPAIRNPHTFRLLDERREAERTRSHPLLIVDVKVRGESLSRFNERRPNITRAPDDYLTHADPSGHLRRALSRLRH